ncbi:hypothetical protein BG006_001305 [Podila minutissima]|uniref:Selenoprotein O n=1 Tax=Podila minutissima TaxID=64525 RepID=A0A9P5SCK8_9FUNG|nr:hypothetical protein BG006_001305 [Podila minutissima]
MASCPFSSATPSSAATPIPSPLPRPRFPAKFTSSLPCDELSSLGHEDGEDAVPVPDTLLSSPRMVRNAVYSFVNPEDQSKNAFLLSWNKDLATEIGVESSKIDKLSWSEEEHQHLVKVLSGGGRSLKTVLEDEKKLKDAGESPRLSQPWAHCYGGHQFGYYAGETINPSTGGSWELQLKGAGKTPYSRFADGYAVLRSSIREYLCAEAVHALGVASSRSLAILSTETMVVREEGGEPGSIVCRAAPSWIRFGSFEIFFYRKDRKNLRQLAEYVVGEVYRMEKDDPKVMAQFSEEFRKEEREAEAKLAKAKVNGNEQKSASTEKSSKDSKDKEDDNTPTRPMYHNRFAKMFAEVARRTALMVSGWQAIGFCHGVMNTDNMSILGLTIDYGPYAFLDKYDPTWICNHSDTEGRYSFQQQPGVCLWNLGRLALTLENLIGAQEQVDDLEWLSQQEADPTLEKKLKGNATDIIVEIMNKSFRDVFLKDYRERMNVKMGLGGADELQDDDLTEIVVPALAWMDDHEVDFHQFYRELADYKVQTAESVADNAGQVESFVKKLVPTPVWQSRGNVAIEECKGWLRPYHIRVLRSKYQQDDANRKAQMNKVNPMFVFRNWVAQKVIERVTDSVMKTRAGSQEPDADKDLLDRVLWMCRHPYGEDTQEVAPKVGDACEVKRNDAGLEAYGDFVGPVPEWGQGIQCSCSS